MDGDALMADFHITISGNSFSETIDGEVTLNTKKLIKTLEKIGVVIESASINSGHFLGGSRNLVQAEKAPEADSNK